MPVSASHGAGQVITATDINALAALANTTEASSRKYFPVPSGSDDAVELISRLAAGERDIAMRAADYTFTQGVSLPSGASINGVGDQTSITVGGATHAINSINAFVTSAGKTGISLRNFKLIGPENGTMTTANGADAGKGMFFDSLTDFVIDNVTIQRFNIQGIYLGACVRGKVTGCTVLEMYSGNGISVDGLASDIVIAHNVLGSIADCAIGVHNGALRTVVEGNVITDTNFGRGVDIFGAPDTVVRGNAMKNVGGSGSAGFGIQVYPGLAGTLPHRCVIEGNSIIDCAQDGILLDSTTAIYDTVINGNQVQSCGGEGIHVTRAAQRTTIVGNSSKDNTGAGLYLEEVGAQVPTGGVVTGNTLNGNGGWGARGTGSVNGFAVVGNSLVGNTSGTTNIPGGTNTIASNS